MYNPIIYNDYWFARSSTMIIVRHNLSNLKYIDNIALTVDTERKKAGNNGQCRYGNWEEEKFKLQLCEDTMCDS